MPVSQQLGFALGVCKITLFQEHSRCSPLRSLFHCFSIPSALLCEMPQKLMEEH